MTNASKTHSPERVILKLFPEPHQSLRDFQLESVHVTFVGLRRDVFQNPNCLLRGGHACANSQTPRSRKENLSARRKVTHKWETVHTKPQLNRKEAQAFQSLLSSKALPRIFDNIPRRVRHTWNTRLALSVFTHAYGLCSVNTHICSTRSPHPDLLPLATISSSFSELISSFLLLFCTPTFPALPLFALLSSHRCTSILLSNGCASLTSPRHLRLRPGRLPPNLLLPMAVPTSPPELVPC